MGLVTEVYKNLSSREGRAGNNFSSSQGENQKTSDERSFKTKTGLVCTTCHSALLCEHKGAASQARPGRDGSDCFEMVWIDSLSPEAGLLEFLSMFLNKSWWVLVPISRLRFCFVSKGGRSFSWHTAHEGLPPPLAPGRACSEGLERS